MKKTLLWLLLGFILQACSSDTPLKEDPTDVENYQPGTIKYHLYVELGLKPSQKDSINSIKIIVEEKDYTILLGRRNNRAWLSKFDPSGEEIYFYELPRSNQWQYSHYNQNSIVFKDDKYLFLAGWESDKLHPEDFIEGFDCDEYLSILDFKTGKELELLEPIRLQAGDNSRVAVSPSNGRYLVLCYELFNMKYSLFHVIGEDGKELYGREWTKKEADFFANEGYIFIDDERVIQGVKSLVKRSMDSPHFSFSIINLKDWKLLKKYNVENGFKPVGDHLGEKDVFYYADSIYLEGKNIKLIYEEVRVEKDEISNTESHKLLNKYQYSINTDTYEVTFEGKK